MQLFKSKVQTNASGRFAIAVCNNLQPWSLWIRLLMTIGILIAFYSCNNQANCHHIAQTNDIRWQSEDYNTNNVPVINSETDIQSSANEDGGDLDGTENGGGEHLVQTTDGESTPIFKYFMKRSAPEYSPQQSSRRRVTLSKRPPTTTTSTTTTESSKSKPEPSGATQTTIDDEPSKDDDDEKPIKPSKSKLSRSDSEGDNDNEDESVEDQNGSREKKTVAEAGSDDYELDPEYAKKESTSTKKPAKKVTVAQPIDDSEDYEASTKKPQRAQKSSSPSSGKMQKPSQGTNTTRQPKASQDRDSPRRKVASEGSTSKTINQKNKNREPDDDEAGEDNEPAPADKSKTKTKIISSNGDDRDAEETDEEEEKEPKVNAKNGGISSDSNADDNSKKQPVSSAPSSRQVAATNRTRKALVKLPFIKPKNESACTPEAYLEFPRDLIGNKWRSRGFVVIHIAVVCYMFYSLALVCEKYFMPSLEEFSQRLNLSPDVAGATLMSAGSSAPELFTAILGVFIAKGDVGTGAIVGSAVFNILFVIGLCAFICTSPTQLNWWPVLRDSVYYCITVLVLILFIYDERVTALESFIMIALYCIYILIMSYNDYIRVLVTNILLSNPNTAKLISVAATNGVTQSMDDVFNSESGVENTSFTIVDPEKSIEEDSMFLAACLVIIQHKRLFRSQLRFRAAAHYIIIKRQHRIQQVALRQQKQLLKNQQEQQLATKQQQSTTNRSDEVNYFGPENEPLNGDKALAHKQRIEAYANSAAISKNKFSIVSRDDYEFWNRPPEEGENYYLWLAKIPVNYVLHYTIPDCVLYPDKYIISFFMSIFWTAFFSYINVWMVTLIGYTFGIPDSVMGFTFLAAGTSVPDCYSSIHAAKNGMADMAVSNSIGSNVFDILIGLAVPWFIQSAIYPGVTATINSRGIVYSVILLFLSLIVTIYLMNKYEWTLKPRLGLALLIAYALFIALTCMLEFNLFGYVNPPPCIQP